MPFQPAGDRARWRIVYDLLVAARTGDVVTYDALGDALGLHPFDQRTAIQMAVRRAALEHEEQDRRALTAIPNEGYRIVEPGAHIQLARLHQGKATNSLVRGQSKVVNVDLSSLEPEVRQTFEIVARAFALQLDFNRRFSIRQDSMEKAMSSLEKRSSRSDEEISILRERLAQLEKQSAEED